MPGTFAISFCKRAITSVTLRSRESFGFRVDLEAAGIERRVGAVDADERR